jgi:hypothetical protein
MSVREACGLVSTFVLGSKTEESFDAIVVVVREEGLEFAEESCRSFSVDSSTVSTASLCVLSCPE